MLYLIGLGLGDERDITVRGLETVRRCAAVYLEAYTSILGVDRTRLEEYYGTRIAVADREFVEGRASDLLSQALSTDVAFLVVGDPYGATTHADLFLRAAKMGVAVRVIHNASIINAAGAAGLQLYNFGQTVSVPFFTPTWRPDSFYDKIRTNRRGGFHTLCLLDIRVREPSEESLFRGRPVYEPPRFMTAKQAAAQLLEVEQCRREGVCGPDSLAIALLRVGSDTQRILSACLGELASIDDCELGPPLHSLVLPGDLHAVEQEMFRYYLFKATP